MTQQEKLELFKEAANRIYRPSPAADEPEKIEETAQRLSLMEYDPGLSCDPVKFLRCTYDDVIRTIQEVISGTGGNEKSEAADIKTIKEQVDLIVYHYNILVKLREDDVDAWETVDELYGEE